MEKWLEFVEKLLHNTRYSLQVCPDDVCPTSTQVSGYGSREPLRTTEQMDDWSHTDFKNTTLFATPFNVIGTERGFYCFSVREVDYFVVFQNDKLLKHKQSFYLVKMRTESLGSLILL